MSLLHRDVQMPASQKDDQHHQGLNKTLRSMNGRGLQTRQPLTQRKNGTLCTGTPPCKRSTGVERDCALSRKLGRTRRLFTEPVHKNQTRCRALQRACSQIASHHLTVPLPDEETPDTGSSEIKALRDEVRQPAMSKRPPFTQPTVASRGRNRRNFRVPSPPTTVAPSSTRTASTTSTSKNKPARVTDTDFRTAVFERYGITVGTKHDMRSPFQHFGTDVPPMEHAERVVHWYQHEQKKIDCHIWLSWTREQARNIAEQYRCMVALKENEAKFSHRGKRYFCLEDDIVLPVSDTRSNTTYFKLEWGPIPDDELLRCPPQINGPSMEPAFTFTTKPDCTY